MFLHKIISPPKIWHFRFLQISQWITIKSKCSQESLTMIGNDSDSNRNRVERQKYMMNLPGLPLFEIFSCENISCPRCWSPLISAEISRTLMWALFSVPVFLVADLRSARSLEADFCNRAPDFHSHLCRNPALMRPRYHFANDGDPSSEIISVRQVSSLCNKTWILRMTISCSSNFLSGLLGTKRTQNWDLDWILDARLQLLSLCGSTISGKWIESTKITRSSFGGWPRVERKYLGLD
jgi:hypothetical protein